MSKKSLVAVVAALLATAAGTACADMVCAESSYCTVTFTRTYFGGYRPGQPYDYVTVSPDGWGSTFAETGITIRVFVKNCQGQPIVGLTAQQIIVSSPSLCICPGGATSDSGTDANGLATFSGTLKAGGCATSLDVYADGVFIGTLRGPGPAFVTVKINSPDAAQQGTSPCYVDSSDTVAFAQRIGRPALYSICFDLNEDGAPTIDASDLSYYASTVAAFCN